MNRWSLSLTALMTDLASLQEMEEQEQKKYKTPCDYMDNDGHYHCPYNAVGGDDCRQFCGLGVDE